MRFASWQLPFSNKVSQLGSKLSSGPFTDQQEPQIYQLPVFRVSSNNFIIAYWHPQAVYQHVAFCLNEMLYALSVLLKHGVVVFSS